MALVATRSASPPREPRLLLPARILLEARPALRSPSEAKLTPSSPPLAILRLPTKLFPPAKPQGSRTWQQPRMVQPVRDHSTEPAPPLTQTFPREPPAGPRCSFRPRSVVRAATPSLPQPLAVEALLLAAL